MMQIYGTYRNHTCVNGKMRAVETIPGMKGGTKESDGGYEFNYDIL
jgi:hypothetical protein